MQMSLLTPVDVLTPCNNWPQPVGSCSKQWPLRMLRKMENGQSRTQAGRMLLSGSIVDICAQIDKLIAQEPAG